MQHMAIAGPLVGVASGGSAAAGGFLLAGLVSSAILTGGIAVLVSVSILSTIAGIYSLIKASANPTEEGKH